MGLRQRRRDLVDAKQGKAERDDDPPGRIWEYKVWTPHGADEGVFGGGGMEIKLDDLGRQGWELVGASGDRLMFKREIPDEAI